MGYLVNITKNYSKCIRLRYLFILFIILISVISSGCNKKNSNIEGNNRIFNNITNNKTNNLTDNIKDNVNEMDNIENNIECNQDRECVPSKCCHSTECVALSRAPDCSNIMCSQECRANTLDCGQGYCKCVDGKCKAIFLE